jgi:alpha-amylase
MGWLKHRVGFGGFRFDFVRGYAPEYTEEYIRATLDENSFCVGENWVDMAWEGTILSYNQDGPRKKLTAGLYNLKMQIDP